MIRKQLDEFPKSTIFVCRNCKILYWNLLTRREFIIKKNGSVLCQYCKRANIDPYDSKEKLLEELNRTIDILSKKQNRISQRNVFDLENLKERLVR